MCKVDLDIKMCMSEINKKKKKSEKGMIHSSCAHLNSCYSFRADIIVSDFMVDIQGMYTSF